VATLLDSPDQDFLYGSGFYFQAAAEQTPIPVSPGATVFMPFTASWGPDNTPIRLTNYREFSVGTTTGLTPHGGFGVDDSVGRRRVFGAFLGEGLPGKGGAGSVIGYRMATGAAARAAHAFANITPAPTALTITARYKGTRGNGFGFTHRPGADVGTDEFVLIEGGREVEVYPYPEGNIAQLAADINATSSLITAVANITGVALTDVSNVALTGGNDGTTLLVGDWTAMFDAIAYEPFGVFAAAGLTDSSILTALYTWQADVAELGKPFFLVEGAAAAEAFSAHKARALARNNSNAMVFGTGSIGDTTLSSDGSEVVISTAEGVARLAGAIARRGEIMDMVNVRFLGWRAVGGMTLAQEKIAATSGMTGLTRDGDPEAPTKIGLGVTSYSSNTTAKPRWHYGNVKFVRTDHGFETDLANDQEHGDLIGELGVSDRARDIVLGRAETILGERIKRGIMQPRSTVMLDPDVPIDDSSDEIALAYDVWDVRGLRKIRNRITLH
jgi:hypothetical protein